MYDMEFKRNDIPIGEFVVYSNNSYFSYAFVIRKFYTFGEYKCLILPLKSNILQKTIIVFEDELNIIKKTPKKELLIQFIEDNCNINTFKLEILKNMEILDLFELLKKKLVSCIK